MPMLYTVTRIVVCITIFIQQYIGLDICILYIIINYINQEELDNGFYYMNEGSGPTQGGSSGQGGPGQGGPGPESSGQGGPGQGGPRQGGPQINMWSGEYYMPPVYDTDELHDYVKHFEGQRLKHTGLIFSMSQQKDQSEIMYKLSITMQNAERALKNDPGVFSKNPSMTKIDAVFLGKLRVLQKNNSDFPGWKPYDPTKFSSDQSNNRNKD